MNSNTTIVSINLVLYIGSKNLLTDSNTTIVSINLYSKVEYEGTQKKFKYNYCFY